MRRLVVAITVVALALLLVGCGGGGEEPAATDAAAPPPPPASAAVDQEAIPDKSIVEAEVFEPVPAGDFVPDEIVERLDSKQPMLLLFVDSSQTQTGDVKKEVDAVVSDNRGIIDLVTYDIGKTRSEDATQLVAVDPALEDDEQGKKAVQFSRELGVSFTPYLVLIDEQGYIIFKWRGPIDRELLDRQVQRLG